MSALVAIGIDPGPIPGVVRLTYDGGTLQRIEVLQCSHTLVAAAFPALLPREDVRCAIGIERFVVSKRAGRSAAARAGEITRNVIGELILAAGQLGKLGLWHDRSAGEVKPWATDDRLRAAKAADGVSLWDATTGMKHARDAARHALFCAAKDGGAPDPLSKKPAAAPGTGTDAATTEES